MKLMSIYKEKKRQVKFKFHTRMFSIKSWILFHIIGDDVISDYAIDCELLVDYYTEEINEDYRDDRD